MKANCGLVLQVGVDVTSGSQDEDPKPESNQVWDPNISMNTNASHLSQPLERNTSVTSGFFASNTANDQAALDSNVLAVQHRDADSAASASQNASHEHSVHSKNPHKQSSKLGNEQTQVSASLQPNGTLKNVTSRSNPQLPAGPPPASLPPADRDDLLIVMPSSIDRMPIVTASRGWRQGVRTYIAFEQDIDLNNASSIVRVRTNACQAPPKRIHCILDHCAHSPAISNLLGAADVVKCVAELGCAYLILLMHEFLGTH